MEIRQVENRRCQLRRPDLDGRAIFRRHGSTSASGSLEYLFIAVPGATTQSMGLPDNPKQGGVWIMNAGTTTAHIMTPGS